MARVLGIAAVLALGLGVLGATEAHAQTRTVVGEFAGPGALAIRNAAVGGLSDAGGIDLVASDEWEAAGGDSGAMGELGIGALVEGTVARRGRRWLARITVTDAFGNQLARHDFQGRTRRALGIVVRRRIDQHLGEAIRASEAPGAPEPAAATPSGSSNAIRIVVREFGGPGSDTARGLVVEELQAQDGLELVANEDVEDAADSLDADLSTPSGRVAVARELGLNGFVEGEVDRRGRRAYTASVRVVNGLDGELIEEATFRGRSARQLVARLRSNLWRQLGISIGSTRAPERMDAGGDEDFDDEELDDEELDDEDFEAFDDGPSGPRPPALSLAGSLRIMSRRLSYKDDIFGQLRAYELGGAPALGLAAEWYPGAHFTDGLAANLGIVFRGEVGVLLQSSDSSGTEFPTETSAWTLGTRWRIPVGDHELGLEMGYSRHAYSIEAANVDNPKPDVPDVDYRSLRFGANGRFEIIEDFSLTVGAAWLHVLSAGEIENEYWFPRLDVSGVQGTATVGYALTDDLEAQLSFDWRRYFYTMNPEPGDPWIAGGAADQYLTGAVGVEWVPGGR